MTFSRKKNALIVTALSLLLVLTCLCPVFATKQANADDVVIPAQQRQIYYYSDRENSLDSIISAQMNNIGIPSTNYHKVLARSNLELFIEDFNHYVDATEYSGIQNAYVIFELQTNLLEIERDKTDTTYLSTLTTFCQNLKQMFSALKSSNCKIMFISNTEEMMFFQTGDSLDPNNAMSSFFSYVDVHVSLDLMTLLAIGASQRLDSAGDFTFYMDVCSDAFLQYLLRYLRYKFDLRDANGKVLKSKRTILHTLYENQQARIYTQIQMTESKYRLLGERNELGEYNEYYLSELLENRLFVGKVAAFCMVRNQNVPSYAQFLSEMNELRDAYGEPFDYFIYNANNVNLPQLDYLEDVYSIHYYPTNFLSSKIGVMINDFLCNTDMLEYDNWFGRATVNHKPISIGDGGWIGLGTFEGIYESQEPLPWLSLWGPILNEED